MGIVFIDTPDLAVEYNEPKTRTYIKNALILPYTPAFLSTYADVVFSIAPALPAGLTIDASNGIINGTPLYVTAAISYTITTTVNAGQLAKQNFVNFNVISDFYYSPSTYIFINAVLINSFQPTLAAGVTITSYAISPSLPNGLIFNTITGAISGTPLTTNYLTTFYIITATKTNNTTIFDTINISVAELQYATLAYEFLAAVLIRPIQPSLSYLYGATLQFAAPAPSGLSVDLSGNISGTMPQGLDPTAYPLTISLGSYQKNLSFNFTVADISYNAVPYVYAQDTEFLYSPYLGYPIIPTRYDAPLFQSIVLQTALPSNLAIDLADGIIYGIPYTATPKKNYILTAVTKSGYTKDITLNIQVNGFSYTEDGSEPEYNLTIFDTVKIILALNVGGYTDFIVTPSLPAGLTLDPITGSIFGIIYGSSFGINGVYYISGLVYPIITIPITINIILPPPPACQYKCPPPVEVPRQISVINTNAMRYSTLMRTGLGQTRFIANSGTNLNGTYTEPIRNRF
jgi:hypothetical protein